VHRHRPKPPGLLILLLLLFLMPGLGAQEYSVFGEIDLEASYLAAPDASQENLLQSLMGVELNHRLDHQNFSFIARHKATMDRTEELDHSLYEAYIDYRTSDLVGIGAGKQRVSWGRGIAFFPTDTLHPSHTRDDVEGFTGLSALVTPTPDLQLTGVVDLSAALAADPGSGANENFYTSLKYALYTSWFAGNLDLALSGVYRDRETLRPGIGFSYDMAGFILTAEGAVEFLTQTLYPDPAPPGFSEAEEYKPYLLAAAGMSRSWVPNSQSDYTWYAAAEYLYAGTGYTKSDEERYFETASAYFDANGTYPTAAYLGQHYLFLLGSLEIYQKISLELSGLANLQDRSSSLGASATLLTIPGMDLSAEGELRLGSSKTEYGALKSEAGAYRLTLKSTVYF
jgi:hypothetical protein